MADAALPATLAPHRPPSWLAAVGLAVGLPLAVLALPLPLALLLSAAALGARLVRRPERWLAVFTWALPFQTVAIMTLFAIVRVPAGPLRAIAGWKEMAVLAVTAGVATRAATRRGSESTRVLALDLVVASLIGLAIVHVAAQAAAMGDVTSPVVAFGLRDSILFMLLYFVGRATPNVGADDRAIARIALMGVVVAAIGVVERFLVPPDLLAMVGIAAYYRDFLNVGSFLMEDRGLPMNLFTWMGGHTVRRMGSVYLSGQGFATPMLVILPAATVLLLDPRRRRSTWAWASYALLWFGLIASVTRTTIVTCGLQAVVLAIVMRRPSFVASGLVAGAVATGVAFLAVPQVAEFIWETATWQSASSVTHASDFERGLESLMLHPWGRGLGTTDLTAVRLGRGAIMGDNLFLKYGVELGWVGFVLHASVLAGIALASVRTWRAGETPAVRHFGAVVLAITVGIAVNGLTAVVYNNHVVSFLFFWLAGATVSLSDRVRAARLDALAPVTSRP